MKTWFKAAKGGNGVGTIAIFSDIGGWGVTANDFRRDLDALGDVSEIALAIGSNGGDVFTGFQIYNMLARHSARIVVTIEGLAASMASVIAMAGDEVVMPENSMMMIHNPAGGVSGGADEVKSFGDALAAMEANIIQAYRNRTGLPADEIAAMMNKTTWLTAKQAKKLGFADRIEKPMAMAANFDISKLPNVPASFGRATTESVMTTATEGTNEQPKAKTPAEVRAEMVAHANEVRSMCKLAGFPMLADALIEKDADLPAVLKALNDAKDAKATSDAAARGTRGGNDVSARHGASEDNGADVEAGLDPVNVYARWNSAGR